MTKTQLCDSRRPRAIIFGVGGGGESFFRNQSQAYDFVGYSDNDASKFGTIVNGLPVIDPKQISGHEFDVIVIASMWVKEIYDQLVAMGIDKTKLYVPPKNQLKNGTPFVDERTRMYATRQIQALMTHLEKEQITCFLDFGTLLGMVREGKILDWDDDIDLSVNDYDFARTVASIRRAKDDLFDNKNGSWSGTRVYDSDGNEYGVSLFYKASCVDEGKINSFEIYLRSRRRRDGFSIPMGAIGNLFVPEFHFDEAERLSIENYIFNAPTKFRDYLTFVYGEWRVPKKNVDFTYYKPVDMSLFGKTDHSPLIKERVFQLERAEGRG